MVIQCTMTVTTLGYDEGDMRLGEMDDRSERVLTTQPRFHAR
jgi:hypothetical protein